MAKKSVILDKEHLENKLKTLNEQQQKVVEILNQYSKLYDKLDGAKEIVQQMLNEIEIKSKEDDKQTESGS
jgi:hypothetical protein